MTVGGDLTWRRFAAGMALALVVGAVLRFSFPTADPPWHASVGITWHDEGPWVHNARNKVLWGRWSLDQWNPMYLTPVFTGLEYVAMRAFGVGQWQVRVVSEAMGLLSILAVGIGVAAFASRRTALFAAALVATNYIWVMWTRAALMEATMVALITISWSAYAAAARRPAAGVLAGIAAVLSFFTKAAAAFFVAALALDAVVTLLMAGSLRRRGGADGGATGSWDSAGTEPKAAVYTLAGLAIAALLFLAFFVLPHWSEFRFYNWQMSVTRKPSYGLKAIVDRVSWLPIVHDFFTRQLAVTVLALGAAAGIAWRWRQAAAGERLLLLWLVLGIAELIVHDVGNERRLVFLIPVLVVLAAIALAGNRRLVPAEMTALGRRQLSLALPVLLYAAYIVFGAIVRVAFLYQVRPGVRSAAAAAVAATVLLLAFWPRVAPWLARQTWSARAAGVLLLILLAGDLWQFAQWTSRRTYENVTASRLVGRWLPPDTLVQGKLANGLALENRIHPVFVGRGFGNYDDRLRRDDIRYLLTYVKPRLGYEGAVITDVLENCPGWRILRTFDVAETTSGHDRAALILKAAHCTPPSSRSPRAKN
jgi:4-amino-4-deoxy-L-arabinose transferase-like glycosyltransferase